MLVVVGLDKYRLLTANYKLRFPGYILASQTNSSLSSCKRLPHVVCPTKYQLVVPAEVRSDSTLGVSCIVQRTFDFFFGSKQNLIMRVPASCFKTDSA